MRLTILIQCQGIAHSYTPTINHLQLPLFAIERCVLHLTGVESTVRKMWKPLSVKGQLVPLACGAVEIDGTQQPLIALEDSVLGMKIIIRLPILLLVPGHVRGSIRGDGNSAGVGAARTIGLFNMPFSGEIKSVSRRGSEAEVWIAASVNCNSGEHSAAVPIIRNALGNVHGEPARRSRRAKGVFNVARV